MGEQEFNNLFARNLTYFMNLNSKTQSDLSKDLQLSKATVSSWCNATRVPRMDKIDMLCEYFNIKRSDLMEDKSKEQEQHYYINEDTRKIAQRVFESKELRLLFDEAADAKPEDIETAYNMLLALKRKEKGEI